MSRFRVLILLVVLLGAWIWFQKDQFINPISGAPLFSQFPDTNLASRLKAPRELAASALPETALDGPAPQLAALKKKLKLWAQCYQEGTCAESGVVESEEFAGVTSNTDEPLEETLRAQDHLIDTFRKLAAGLKESGDALALEQLVREYLTFPNDYVKESAIQWLDQLPLSHENLTSLVQGLESSSSQPLQEAALGHLRKYYEAGYHAEVTDHLVRQIRQGGHFVSQYLARQSGKFLTGDNVQKFEDLLRAVNPGSHVHQLLDAQIREFRRAHAPADSSSN